MHAPVHLRINLRVDLLVNLLQHVTLHSFLASFSQWSFDITSDYAKTVFDHEMKLVPWLGWG